MMKKEHWDPSKTQEKVVSGAEIHNISLDPYTHVNWSTTQQSHDPMTILADQAFLLPWKSPQCSLASPTPPRWKSCPLS